MDEILKYYNLQDNPEIELVNYGSEEEWLEERKKGIGGSDAAAVLGLSKYTSPLQLYKVKTGEVSESHSESVYTRKGKDLEALIRNVYVIPYFKELGYHVVHPTHMFVNKSIPWLRANCDGIAIPIDEKRQTFKENIIVEIKWVSEYGETNWNKDAYYGIPPEYYAQVQHYMLVTGAKLAVVCALFDREWKPYFFEIPYDVSFAAHLRNETFKFYEFNVGMHIAPKLDAVLDKDELIEAIKKESDAIISGAEDFEKAVEEYLHFKAAAEVSKQSADICAKKIAEMYASGHRSIRHTVKISACSKTSFNSSKFAKDNPELYKQYLQETKYTRTVIK